MFPRPLRSIAIHAMFCSCALQAGLGSVAQAVKVELNSSLVMRELVDSQMERVGLLTKGSVVEIPDDFTVLKNGKPDLELTLNKWLREAGKATTTTPQPGRFKFDGEKFDFFYPVRVISPAAGSTVSSKAENATPFIALSKLVRSHSALIVAEDAPLVRGPRGDTPQAANKPAEDPRLRDLEAGTPCANGACSNPSDKSDPVRNLVLHLGTALSKAKEKSDKIFSRTNGDLDALSRNVQSSCGFSVSELTSMVKTRAKTAGIPAEILLALMTQESSGKCFVLNSETDDTQSVGLFQINTKGSRFPRCTEAQKNQLRGVGAANKLEQGPRCLENPIVNLEEAIRIVKLNKSYLTRNPPKGFDSKALNETDLWRLVASSYNGGARWALTAKEDLEKFNKVNGTNLNPHSWEDLRLFYLRSWLGRNDDKQFFETTTARRSRKNSISNLAYAENLFGRPAVSRQQKTLAQLWTDKLRSTN